MGQLVVRGWRLEKRRNVRDDVGSISWEVDVGVEIVLAALYSLEVRHDIIVAGYCSCIIFEGRQLFCKRVLGKC